MIEDIQTGIMSASAPQSMAASSQIQKRAPGGTMNTQHEYYEKSKGAITGGITKSINRKGGRQNSQWNNKREVTSSRNIKKAPGDYTKRLNDSLDRKSSGNNGYPDSLVNFHYLRLRGQQASGSSNYYSRRRRTTFNKEAFLQANCLFVVDYDEEKYLIHSVDPDVLVEWDAIQLVYLPTHETPNCPICLYPPTAAKITKCGHVYCWACVIHYLTLGDKSWRKCPICYEAINEKDLKSVVPVVQNKFARNGTITMKLMKRPKNSLYACPVDEWDPTKIQFSTWNGKPIHSSSKLTLAMKETVLENILMREKIELTAQLNEAIQEENGEESFVRIALENLKAKITAYSSVDKKPFESFLQPDIEEKHANYGPESNLHPMLVSEKLMKAEAFSDDEESDSSHPKAVFQEVEGDLDSALCGVCETDEKSISKETEKKLRNSESSSTENSVEETNDSMVAMSSKNNSEFYYFYQAEDGQSIFINSLNARCLIEEYGSLERSPKKIVGQILDFESHTMTKELRKRYRYLSHLPVSCEFIICELMLRPPVLSKHTIHNFMGEFKKRKTLRMKKLEEQRRHDLRANAELSRGAGYRVETYDDYQVELDISDLKDFPSHNLSPVNILDNNNQSTTLIAEEDAYKGPSFAQMLKTASSSPPTSHPVAARGVWGKQPSQPDVNYTRTLTPLDDEDEDGPNICAPSLKEMFSAAMFTSTITKSTAVESAESEGAAVKGGKKGKKGKAKGTLLFATGAQRKY